MTNENDDFLKQLLSIFHIEASEHLKAVSAGLIELEKNPTIDRYVEIIEMVFREVHSLKGAARAVNLREIESICHPLESVLATLKSGELSISQPLIDTFYQAIDALDDVLVPGAGTSASRKAKRVQLIQRLNNALQERFAQSETIQRESSPHRVFIEPVSEQPPVETNEPVTRIASSTVPTIASETVRVSTQKLDKMVRQIEELQTPRLASAQRAKELRELAVAFANWSKQRAHLRPVLRHIERFVEGDTKESGGDLLKVAALEFQTKTLPKLLAHLTSEQSFMKKLEEQLLRLSRFAAHDLRELAGMSDSLLHDVKEMQLLPFSSLFAIYPRFIRELAREQGKQVKLLTQDDEIEIDRHTLEEIKDPLMHLLRNSVDHGIEQPAIRQDKGKPAHGTISISVVQKDGGKIEIKVADDGVGVDTARVKAVSSKLGLVSTEDVEKLNEQEAQALIFQSGISTNRIITDISGRGLGLAIVREKIERLGGAVVLEPRQNNLTTFSITLPLTLATFRGVLVRTDEHYFIIPALNLERVIRLAQQNIQTTENRTTILLDGQAIALANLGDVLELPRKRDTDQITAQIVVLGTGHKHVAFRVDEIFGEQEVLVKTLGRQLARVRNIAGASVLGNGRVVAVLNVHDLLKSAAHHIPPVVAQTQGVRANQSILVVEDSIASGVLLKKILESAGYIVTTAVDGVDAYTILKSGAFDMIVSDVKMPRLDGFALTAKVRADKQFGELPVVLVTSLDSPEHRERGINVGANAYVIKNSFDQNNLLEVVGRLI